MRIPRTAQLAAATAMGLLLLAPTGASANEATPVTPAPPVFTDACGRDSDQVLIPFTQGVDYYLGGVKVNPGVRQINPSSPRAQVFTRAADGYALTAPATWTHTYDEERGCDGEAYVKTGNVEPTAPVEGETDEPTPTQDEDETVVIGADDDDDETVVITDDDEELPRTGFDSNSITLIGGVTLLGAGALALNQRRLNRSGV